MTARPASLAASAPMRVALVTETYPPEVNGVATTLAQVVERLRARGHAVQLVRPRQASDRAGAGPGVQHEVLVRGMPVPRYPHLKMGLPCRGRLERLWRELPPDMVHIATEGPLGWSALQAARRLGLPVTTDFRTNFHEYSRHYGLGRLAGVVEAYLRHFHNGAHGTMVPTAGLRDALAAQGFERLRVVSRGVDAERFHPRHRSDALRAAWGADEHTLVVVCVGRLAPEKNLDLLIQAHRAMHRLHPRLRLVLVGEGPSRAALERQHPDVVFAGQRLGQDLAAHYASADLFVFPSLTETFGNVTQEAMASGLPVVAFDHAAAGQLVRPGRHGWLARAGDAQDFIAQACRAIAEPQALRPMGQAAREAAAARGWDRIIDQIDAHFREAVGAGPWEELVDAQVVPAG